MEFDVNYFANCAAFNTTEKLINAQLQEVLSCRQIFNAHVFAGNVRHNETFNRTLVFRSHFLVPALFLSNANSTFRRLIGFLGPSYRYINFKHSSYVIDLFVPLHVSRYILNNFNIEGRRREEI